tara:strand:+ start:150 stop:767 length:618 start_codon:yes stop_codon:yes gene_type:complete
MKKTMMIELPKENMTNGKFRTDRKTSQVCVIPNTEDNRTSIRHINKLAKQQNSHFRLKMRYRCPKEGKHYGWHGDVACEDARGIGIYIVGATANSIIQKNHSEIGRQDDEMDKVLLENLRLKEKEVELRKTYETYHNAMKEKNAEIERMQSEIWMLKENIATKDALENLESACEDYKNKKDEDDVYEKMCDMVGSLWNYNKETQV